MAITFTNNRLLATNTNSLIWQNQSQASSSFFFRYELTGSTTSFGQSDTVGYPYGIPFLAYLIAGSNSQQVNLWSKMDGLNGSAQQNVVLLINVVYHIAMTWDQGIQRIWINGTPYQIGTATGLTKTQPAAFNIGSAPSGTGTVYTIDDIAVWNGYALTSTDVANLAYGIQSPNQIGGSASARFAWTLRGTIGNAPIVGDIGVKNDFGNATYDIASIYGSGSAVYSSNLVVTPIQINKAYIGTSGKTCVCLFSHAESSSLVSPIQEITAPTIFRNGSNLGQLINSWITGYHKCVVYCLPMGTSVNPGDVMTVTAPLGWMNTDSGLVQSLNNMVLTNLVGRSVFGTNSLIKTLRMGLNFSENGPINYNTYILARNLRYRVTAFANATQTASGKPITLTGGSGIAGMYDVSSFINHLDDTGYPGVPGLYAVGWDDLNPSSPTYFALYTNEFPSTTVTEVSELENTGTLSGGRINGLVRVFNVQHASGSTVAYLKFRLMVENSNNAPMFDNLVVYGPGDFTYQSGIPVILDKSDPYAVTSIALDRLHNGMGSARWMDSVLNTSAITSTSEPEQLHNLTDFTWGFGAVASSGTINYTQVRPWSITNAPYVYSSLFGNSFAATLASGIDAITTTLTISDAATAPVLIGLTLTVGSEIMRVLNVSGTTVTVSRGAESSTAAIHSAGTIQVNYRTAISSISDFGGSMVRIAEYMSQSPHGLKTAQNVQLNYGTWPTLNFTDGSSLSSGQQSGASGLAYVTGANTFVIQWGNSSSAACTLTGPVTLSPPSSFYTTWQWPDVPGFPYEFSAITTGRFAECDLHVNIPLLASNTLVDEIARRIRDHFPVGRKVWVELSNECWNFAFLQWSQLSLINSFVYRGQNFYDWLTLRSGQIAQRFRDRFNEGSRNRSGEIKLVIGTAPDGGQASTVFSFAQSNNIVIDAIAVGIYLDSDSGNASVTAWNAADDEQAIDLWIHDLYYKDVGGLAASFQNTLSAITDYNTATGNSCVLYGYEGGIQTTTPGNYQLQRTRDMVYNPNWRIIEQDVYAFFQRNGFSRFNIFAYNLGHFGNTNWGIYHWPGQLYGHGDGSDNKADNRLCLATPGKPFTKDATTNQDQQNVSVRGQALLDWMNATSSPKKYRPLSRSRR